MRDIRRFYIRRLGFRRAAALLVAVTLGFLGLPLIASPADAASATPTFTQVRAKEITSGTLNSLAFNSANTAGNLIVVYLTWTNTDSVSVTDTRGNAYTSVGSRTTWGAAQQKLAGVLREEHRRRLEHGPSDLCDCDLIVGRHVHPRVLGHRQG